jgi:hypothetical protein
VVTATGAGLVHAASTGFWIVATQADFLKGDTDAVSIDTVGRVTIGPALQALGDVGTPAVWRIATDGRGQVWAATGHDGKLWVFGASGPGKVLFDAAELDIQAIAPGPQGSVLAGSSPDGKVYRVAPDGTSTTFFDPEDKYIWAIASAPDGTVYVATGNQGKVYKVPAGGGSGTVFYDAGADHVSALAFDASGRLLAGTSNPGRVVRLERDGKPFVLLEAGYQEVRSLRVAGDLVYATAAGPSTTGAGETPARPSTDTTAAVTMSTEITVTAVGDTAVVTPGTPSTSGESRASGPQKGAVYRIAADGDWTTMWESADDVPYDVLAEKGGTLLVATGGKGKLYRLSGEPVVATLVTRADAQQITALAEDGAGGILLGASNPGRVLRLAGSPAASGTYISDVRDTTTVATWGTLRWQANLPQGTSIVLHTRSGNTRTPDTTWSGWSAAYTTPLGSLITSPKARYLQWKAVLTGAKGVSPVMTSVSAAYLPRNTRPIVDSVTVHPAGVVFQRPFPTGDPELAGLEGDGQDPRTIAPGTPTASQTLGRRTFQKSLQTFVWSARDADGDRLQYTLSYRREGEPTWTPLKSGLADDVFTWDTTTVPDGTYLIKVTASDAGANAPALALEGERESQTFDIDNTPPDVEVTPGNAARTVRFVVRDAQSAIQRVEYASAADRWKQAYPVDGLLDSREERFELTLEAGAKGPVVVRATDALGNVATATLRP